MTHSTTLTTAVYDPLYSATWKLFIRDVLEFEEHETEKNHLCFQTHIFSKVEVCGLVVSLKLSSYATFFEIDDGTSVLACVMWSQSSDGIDTVGFHIGCFVSLEGKLNIDVNMRHLHVKRLEINHDPNAEALFAEQVWRLRRDVYSRSWHPPNFLTVELLNGEENAHWDTRKEKRQVSMGVFNYLKDTFGLEDEFSLEALQRDVKLKELVTMMSPDAFAEQDPVESLLNNLVEHGLIYKLGNITKIYGFVPYHCLHHYIESILRLPAYKNGARVEDIWQRLRWDYPKFVNVTKQSIKKVIVELDDTGVIFECHYERFKLAC